MIELIDKGMTSITPADTHSINGTGQKGGDYIIK